VTIDPSFNNLLVAFQGGCVQIHNVYSGAVLFNKTAEESLKLEQEVSNVKYFSSQAGYWFVATCWEGYVAFFSLP
jgi:uncharacterized protein YneR